MTLIFLIIFTIFVFGLMIVFSLVKGVSSLIFGKSSYFTNDNNSSTKRQQYNTSRSHKKVFSKDEGEYVSYQEIKE